MDAGGEMAVDIVSLALTSPRVGGVKPAKVAKLPAEVVHFKVPPALDTAKRYE